MKTVNKLNLCAVAALLGVGCFSVSSAYAQEVDLGLVSPSGISVPEINDVELSAKADTGKKDKKKSSAEDIADSVQDVIDRLNSETENVSLEDLNAAREAIVKLDVLIDIEKRLNDLSKLRDMRGGSSAFAGALPASALQPPTVEPELPVAPIAAPIAQPQPVYAPAPVSSSGGVSSDIEVIRISGAAGSYFAQIKDPSGSTQAVREGDRLSDGTRVVLISSQGVTFKKNDDKATIQVKDVSRVFSR